MRKFFESQHCVSRKHCEVCRNKNKKNFREVVSKSFDDIKDVDFKCPFGMPWGHKVDNKDKKTRKEQLLEERRLAVEARNSDELKDKRRLAALVKDKSAKNKTPILNYRYILRNESTFHKIDGFVAKKQSLDDQYNKLKEQGKCPPCVRGKLNLRLQDFVIRKVKEVIDDLDDNMVIPLQTPMTVGAYKEVLKGNG